MGMKREGLRKNTDPNCVCARWQCFQYIQIVQRETQGQSRPAENQTIAMRVVRANTRTLLLMLHSGYA